jgi:CheY-like chemotaxis protein
MPVKDGFTTLKEIKAQGIKTPIIISSNLSQEEDLKKAKDLGAIDFFIKSNTPISEIVENIKKYLN